MRVLVCGGRDYENYGAVATVLSALANDTVVIEGGATGADRHAKRYAFARGLRGETYPADWQAACQPSCAPGHRKQRGLSDYCPAEGSYRNGRMLNTGIDLVIAFPGGRGTDDMKRQAKAIGVLVLSVEHD